MKPGVRGKRGKQKILEQARQQAFGGRSPTRYVEIDKLLTNYETTYQAVHGKGIEVAYKKGYYYIGNVKMDHNRLEKELSKLLLRERELNQIGGTNVRKER